MASRRQSPVRALVSIVVVLVLGLIFVPLIPRLAAELARSVFLPEASGGPYAAIDSEQCYAARDELKTFPGDGASEATKLSLGSAADLPTARAEAAAATALYAEKARTIDAPATRSKLDEYSGAFEGAKAEFEAPMTENEFRSAFRDLKGWMTTLTLHCQAIDRWIKANVRQ